MFSLGGGSIYRLLNKNIKEFNKVKLSTICIVFLLTVGFISYKINSSYALFSDSITGEKTIEATVDMCSQNKPNAPVLDSAMIPVYYDETSETWKKADSTNKSNNWYDYCEKKWANSVTVADTNRSTYQNAEVGTEIPLSDILTMQVWIPRYKYKVWNYNADGTVGSKPQQIEITFESKNNKTGEITCEDAISGTDESPSETCKQKKNNTTCTDDTCNNKTYTHPAFTFGDKEINGFWVGKFEITGTIDNITTKPNTKSIKNQNISTFETNILNMQNNNNQYGFSGTTDTHMIKNSEWGAVIYLSHSKYGLCIKKTCSEVNINNSSSMYTGRSGGYPGGYSAVNKVYKDKSTITKLYNTYGFYRYDGYLLDYLKNHGNSQKNISRVASTTKNIYGVYDMSGGADEYTMANVVGPDATTMISGSGGTYIMHSGYTGLLRTENSETDFVPYTGIDYPDKKYYDIYSYNIDRGELKTSKLGDGIRETYKQYSDLWYNDSNGIGSSNAPWFCRGGNYNSGKTAGFFYSNPSYGEPQSDTSTRLIITP